MLALVSSTLGILSSMKKNKLAVDSDCIKFEYKTMEIPNNETACEYIKTYDIMYGCHISVCKHRDQIGIDFRLFKGRTPTAKGILLNKRQWDYLQKIILLKQSNS